MNAESCEDVSFSMNLCGRHCDAYVDKDRVECNDLVRVIRIVVDDIRGQHGVAHLQTDRVCAEGQ